MQSNVFETAPKNAPSNSDKVFYTRPAWSDNIFSAWRVFFYACRHCANRAFGLSIGLPPPCPGRLRRRASAISPLQGSIRLRGLRLFRPLQGSMRLRGLRLFRPCRAQYAFAGFGYFALCRAQYAFAGCGYFALCRAQYAFAARLFRPLQGSMRRAQNAQNRRDFRISLGGTRKK